MKAHYPVAGYLALLLILALGLLYSTRSVSAAAEGKFSGTIKLDGTPAHQRPIDMSKEPNCQKAHAGHPVTTETVVTGPNIPCSTLWSISRKVYPRQQRAR